MQVLTTAPCVGRSSDELAADAAAGLAAVGMASTTTTGTNSSRDGGADRAFGRLPLSTGAIPGADAPGCSPCSADPNPIALRAQ